MRQMGMTERRVKSGPLGDRALPAGESGGPLGDRALPAGESGGPLGERALPKNVETQRMRKRPPKRSVLVQRRGRMFSSVSLRSIPCRNWCQNAAKPLARTV